MDDGMCDEVNNRAYCNWDSGDCCVSTCADCRAYYGVSPWPLDCTEACLCYDPNAAENIAPEDEVVKSHPNRMNL